MKVLSILCFVALINFNCKEGITQSGDNNSNGVRHQQ